jgi:glucose 1-dehydrogenase
MASRRNSRRGRPRSNSRTSGLPGVDTATAALEGIDNGIRVNALGVGDVVTNILGDPIDLVEDGKGAPINRAADPTEIAHIAAFLASDLGSYAVGAVWMVDGGMSVAIPN